jgi:uncharacterized damage-inducible protein DinB
VDVKEAPPAAPPAAELLQPFSQFEGQVMALAKAVPEEKYSWRPGPGVRSVKEVLLHIAYGNQLLLNVANNSPSKEALEKQIDENAKGESASMSKDQVMKFVEDSFASVRKTLDEARAASLNRTVDFFGRPSTRRGVLITIDTHVAEHLGQLIAYARVNGIVPPWSK